MVSKTILGNNHPSLAEIGMVFPPGAPKDRADPSWDGVEGGLVEIAEHEAQSTERQ